VLRPAGTKSGGGSAWCGKNSDGTGFCSFDFFDVRNDTSSDWVSFGSSIGNGTYGWNNGTYGWLVATVGGNYFIRTSSRRLR
jgi:hypothetical protein